MQFTSFKKMIAPLRAKIRSLIQRRAILHQKTIPIKQACVKQYGQQYRIHTLIETGTFRGDMIAAVKDLFHKIYSIELGERLYAEAKKRFDADKQINIIKGDSGDKLSQVMQKITEPCVFWLDGHYSGGDTACGKRESPVLQELQAIFAHPLKSHIILIDDARCFDDSNIHARKERWPSLDDIRNIVEQQPEEWTFEIKDDVIRIMNRSREKMNTKPR